MAIPHPQPARLPSTSLKRSAREVADLEEHTIDCHGLTRRRTPLRANLAAATQPSQVQRGIVDFDKVEDESVTLANDLMRVVNDAIEKAYKLTLRKRTRNLVVKVGSGKFKSNSDGIFLVQGASEEVGGAPLFFRECKRLSTSDTEEKMDKVYAQVAGEGHFFRRDKSPAIS